MVNRFLYSAPISLFVQYSPAQFSVSLFRTAKVNIIPNANWLPEPPPTVEKSSLLILPAGPFSTSPFMEPSRLFSGNRAGADRWRTRVEARCPPARDSTKGPGYCSAWQTYNDIELPGYIVAAFQGRDCGQINLPNRDHYEGVSRPGLASRDIHWETT